MPGTQARSKAILTPGVVPLEISIRESDGDVTVLDLRGRATISDGESDLLGARLDQLIANGAHKFILNLAELTHVDSSGFSVIVKVCVSARDKGGDVRFVRPRGSALQAFKILHLLDLMRTFDNEAEALASYKASS